MSPDHKEQPWLAGLCDAAAYPEDPSAAGGIARVDTHISHVFLTGERVYKLRRPVKLPFLDFTEREERLADCLREVTLNRRLAPDVYLGIAPVRVDGHGVRVGAIREVASYDPLVVEHCVVMRRLRKGRDLRSLIERREVTTAHIDRIAARLAVFHRSGSLGTPAPFAADDWLARTTGPARENVAARRAPGRSCGPRRRRSECRIRRPRPARGRSDTDPPCPNTIPWAQRLAERCIR